MMIAISAIIVSHNSDLVLPRCLDALARQTVVVREIIVIDCGSDDRSYLFSHGVKEGVRVVETSNVGFSRANNLGMGLVSPQTDFVVFLNPDTFLTPGFIETAVEICLHHPKAGIVSGKLNGYDIKQNVPTGRIDSTGIFRTWYGHWIDRGQGEQDCGQYEIPELVPALCGALLFCRMTALRSLSGPVFDPDFFLYKEDIELSLRIRKAGWHLLYHPKLLAYHGRGWNKKRGDVPVELRYTASANEILLYRKHFSPYMIWAWWKYLLVRFFHL